MKLAVLSDSHDNQDSVKTAVEQIKGLGIQQVVHCGDICTPYMLELFVGLDAKFVFGNCDWDEVGLKEKTKELGFEIDYSQELSIGKMNMLFCHGDKELILDHAVESQSFQFVFHGHSHQIRDEQVGITRVINPGALYRAKTYSFVTLDSDSGELEFHEVEK